MKRDDHKVYNIIFDPIEAAFKRGSQIVLWKTLKANGENCSVAWVSAIGAWAISSKNVCLLARSRDDIQL